jgi:hypothetical protein
MRTNANGLRVFRFKGHLDQTTIEFDERVSAFSERQARFILHRRVEARHPDIRVFLIYDMVKELTAVPRRAVTPQRKLF